VLLDTHCHLDLYPEPAEVAKVLEATDTIAVAVTARPSAFKALQRRFGRVRRVRPALGVHPLEVGEMSVREWQLFEALVDETTYIGEVGLDFGPQGVASRPAQEDAFRRVLRTVAGRGKVLSVHSRRAEATALELLVGEGYGPVVFHWYTGPAHVLDAIVARGHYLSINPAMTQSDRGRRLIARIPRDRILLESDGPFAVVDARPALPSDVRRVVTYLAETWAVPPASVTATLHRSFLELLERAGTASRRERGT